MNVKELVQALSYVRRFSGETILIKLGGSILDEENSLKGLCSDMSLLRAVGVSLLIVHGGSKAINAAFDRYCFPIEFQNGSRVTSPEAMDVIESVLSGQVNKSLVRNLHAVSIRAIGLSGVDNRLLQCRAVSDELGRVGEIVEVNVEWLRQLLESQSEANAGMVPVISSVGIDDEGKSYNVNADWAACRIAAEMKIKKVIYLTDQNGICDRDGKVFSKLNPERMRALKEDGIVQGGMLAKVDTILSALSLGVEHIQVINGKSPHSLIEELFTDRGSGTLCLNEIKMERIDEFIDKSYIERK